jgi:SAM-dependent methyltransferase
MAKLGCLKVPDSLQRNAPEVLAHGVENTGESLLRTLARRIGRSDLTGLDLLDIGCGVRFTQTLINRDLVFRSYTGIEVSRPIVEWLKEHVESKDERFRFVHWNVHNAKYNPQAPRMDTYQTLPVDAAYDVVMGYSVFTHLTPDDTACMLRLVRKVVRPHGYLFFTAFCDDSIPQFEDRVPDKPLLKAYYNNRYLENLVNNTGWTLVSYEPPGGYMMDSFLCQSAA